MIRNAKLLLFLALVGLLPLSGIEQTSGQNSISAAADPNHSAEHAFKNLQVLKEIPAEQLIPSMQFIAASLGVDCSYCHVEGALDKDDKTPKATARKMMRMMFTINKENFENRRKVTCYSCHRGAPKPTSVPPVAIDEPKNMVAAEAAEDGGPRFTSELPGPEQVLAKYTEAVGGGGKPGTVSSRLEKGVATLPGGKQIPVEVFSKPPDRRLFVMHLAKGDNITGYDGHMGWLSFPGQAPLRMSNEEAEGAKLDAALQFPVDLKNLFRELKVARLEHIGQQETYLMLGINPGAPPVEMYFGKQSGVLVRLVRYADSALGLNPIQIDYEDYRESGGLKVPYHWSVARPNGTLTVQILQAQEGVPLEDKQFSKPDEKSLLQH